MPVFLGYYKLYFLIVETFSVGGASVLILILPVVYLLVVVVPSLIVFYLFSMFLQSSAIKVIAKVLK